MTDGFKQSSVGVACDKILTPENLWALSTDTCPNDPFGISTNSDKVSVLPLGHVELVNDVRVDDVIAALKS